MGIEVMGKNGNGNAVLESEWVGMGIIRWEWERNENKKVGPLTSESLRSVREFGAPQQISTGFASWQRYCTAL